MPNFELGAYSTLDVGLDQIALVSRETRGWAVVSESDYALLVHHLSQGPVTCAEGTDEETVLLKLHEVGLLRKDGVHLFGSRPAPPKAPDALLLKMTGGCNLSCTYCYDFSESRRPHHLDPTRAIDTINTIVEATGKLTITFHGGEPLLQLSQIKTIVEHCEGLRASGASLRYAIQTNGTLLTGAVIDFLERHAFSVGISVDGISEATDRLRRPTLGSGEDPSAMLYRLLRDHGDFIRRRCGILSVVCATTLPELPDFARWLQDQGISGLSTTVLDKAGRADGMDEEGVTPEALVNLYKKWLDLICAGEIKDLALTNLLAYIDNLCTFDPPSFCQKGPCGAAGDFLVIDADGSYRACDCVIHPFFVIGSPNTKPNEVMGHGPRDAIIKRYDAMLSQSFCAECLWMQICGGTCAAKAIGYSSKLNSVYDPECALNRFLYPRLLDEYAQDPDGPIFNYHKTHSRLAKKKEK